MPQMMPINWIFFFIYFIMIFIMFNILNYYIYNIKLFIPPKTSIMTPQKNNLWKW